MNAKQPAGMQVSSKVARDSLNITNSLIISNSQILFQDMGNGKIVPVPMQFNQLNQMGTIQPQLGSQGMVTAASMPGSTIDNQRSEVSDLNRKASMASQKNNHSSSNAKSRHARRKTAQSTNFNTINAAGNVPKDYINLDNSAEQNF